MIDGPLRAAKDLGRLGDCYYCNQPLWDNDDDNDSDPWVGFMRSVVAPSPPETLRTAYLRHHDPARISYNEQEEG